MERDTRFLALLSLTVAVWSTAISVLVARQRLAAKAPIPVTITTLPKDVRIEVRSDKPQSKIAYTSTPTKLSLPPTRRNRVRIAREGYIAHDITIEGDPGDQINLGQIVLERDPGANFGKLVVRQDSTSLSADDTSLVVQALIDDGLLRGELPLESDDLPIGPTRTLVLSAQQAQGGEAPLTAKCWFSLTEQHQDKPLIIKVKKVRGKGTRPASLKVTPCGKAKAE